MKKIIIGLLSAFFITSCCVYHPQAIDIPLIKQKHDLRIDGGVSIIPSANATVSYGLTSKMALQVFGAIGSDERYYFQLAPGVYKAFRNHTVAELYTGLGYGHGNAYRDANPGNMYGNYQLFFVQGNFGKTESKFLNMDLGFGFKLGYFHSDLTDQNYYSFYSENGPFSSYNEKSFLIEPLAFARSGGEKLKFNIKIGYCNIYKITNTDKYIPTYPLNIGLGLNYYIKSK